MSDAAIPASTLILVRDRDAAPPELLMVERSDKMAFAAGALVFPGGRIDEADVRLAQDLGLADGAMIAAIRETIEETAVPAALAPLPDAEAAARMQQRLAADEAFAAVLDDTGIAIDAAGLTAFARWVRMRRARLHYVACSRQVPSGIRDNADFAAAEQRARATRASRPGWRNGRRSGLKIRRWKHREGSNPSPGTRSVRSLSIPSGRGELTQGA